MSAPARMASKAYPSPLRVTGALTEDARLCPGTGEHRALLLTFQPVHGLPYLATVDLGVELADHMAAEQLLPHMRAGAVVSVAGKSLELRMDHGHAALRLMGAHSVVVLEDPITAEA